MTWEAFRGKFLSEYFPNNIRYAKEVEFLQLTQGGKSVTEYDEKFKHLSRFYTLPLDEEWRCRKFENGLRGDIRFMVAPLSIKDFAALVETADEGVTTSLEAPSRRITRSMSRGESSIPSRGESFNPSPLSLFCVTLV